MDIDTMCRKLLIEVVLKEPHPIQNDFLLRHQFWINKTNNILKMAASNL